MSLGAHLLVKFMFAQIYVWLTLHNNVLLYTTVRYLFTSSKAVHVHILTYIVLHITVYTINGSQGKPSWRIGLFRLYSVLLRQK